ncbi:MAG: hypothetical protein AB7I27_08275 [Bacteriovoracaceae bacterium]
MKFLIGLYALSLMSFAHADDRAGNGGFLYSRTSKKLLDASQASLQNELAILLKTRSDLTYSSNECPKPIDFRKLNSITSDLAYTYTTSSSDINPDGREEKKFFQINKDGKVEATEVYFSAFVDTYFRYQEEGDVEKKEQILEPVRTAIIHEALHLFEYGEMDSRKCSEDLIKVIESYNDTKLRILREIVNAENDQLVFNLLQRTGGTQEWLDSVKRVSNDMMFQIAQRRIKYLYQIDKFEFEAENQSKVRSCNGNSYCRSISELADVINNTDNIFEIAKFLNAIFRFSFEKELPTKL